MSNLSKIRKILTTSQDLIALEISIRQLPLTEEETVYAEMHIQDMKLEQACYDLQREMDWPDYGWDFYCPLDEYLFQSQQCDIRIKTI